jgi:hypothetical protein
MDDTDPDKLDAVRARLEAEREQRLTEKVAAGKILSIPLFVAVGTASAADAAVEQVKADKLKELHTAGETREVVFATTIVVTGVCKHGEATVHGEPWKPTAPPYLPRTSSVAPEPNEEEAVRADPQPPLFETYISVQTRACHDDDDAGEIAEGWFSIDGKVLTVTDANGKYVGSRAMLEGEDARVVAKQLLREKKAPESESFSRPLSYPNAGLA